MWYKSHTSLFNLSFTLKPLLQIANKVGLLQRVFLFSLRLPFKKKVSKTLKSFPVFFYSYPASNSSKKKKNRSTIETSNFSGVLLTGEHDSPTRQLFRGSLFCHVTRYSLSKIAWRTEKTSAYRTSAVWTNEKPDNLGSNEYDKSNTIQTCNEDRSCDCILLKQDRTEISIN